jgi:hypothetical protein
MDPTIVESLHREASRRRPGKVPPELRRDASKAVWLLADQFSEGDCGGPFDFFLEEGLKCRFLVCQPAGTIE